jgi:SAM-dependent methyltransferase
MTDKAKKSVSQTIEYYEKQAEQFVSTTIGADMSGLYVQFEKYLIPSCRILDLGCGSGRDSRYFSEKGYEVVAVDPSPTMCGQTSKFAGVPIVTVSAEEMNFREEFDAIWACASLLHVSRDKMPEAFRRIRQALRKEGICYCSFKYGDSDRVADGRYFADYNEEMLVELLQSVGGFEIINMWVTGDVRTDRAEQKWINAILRKIEL